MVVAWRLDESRLILLLDDDFPFTPPKKLNIVISSRHTVDKPNQTLFEKQKQTNNTVPLLVFMVKTFARDVTDKI